MKYCGLVRALCHKLRQKKCRGMVKWLRSTICFLWHPHNTPRSQMERARARLGRTRVANFEESGSFGLLHRCSTRSKREFPKMQKHHKWYNWDCVTYNSQILLRHLHAMHKGHRTPKGTKCSSRAVKSRLQKRTPLWCWCHSSHHRHTLARKARGLHQVQPHWATRWKPLQAALHTDGRFKTDENNDLFTWLQRAEGESPKSGNKSHRHNS